jgi:hypothetical protein
MSKILEMLKSTSLDVSGPYSFFADIIVIKISAQNLFLLLLRIMIPIIFAECPYPVTFEFCEWHP